MPRCYTEAFGKTLLRNAKAFCEKLVLFILVDASPQSVD